MARFGSYIYLDKRNFPGNLHYTYRTFVEPSFYKSGATLKLELVLFRVGLVLGWRGLFQLSQHLATLSAGNAFCWGGRPWKQIFTTGWAVLDTPGLWGGNGENRIFFFSRREGVRPTRQKGLQCKGETATIVRKVGILIWMWQTRWLTHSQKRGLS